MDRQTLQQFAGEAGADVFGVANIERFDELPADKHPRAIFPEARSVVVIGRRITRGTLRGVEEGTNFTNYSLYGSDWLDNRFVALTTFRVTEFLEDHGIVATIADERALSMEKSPFRTVRSLSEYLSLLVDEQEPK